MQIYTLNVGQGNFNVVVGENEAFIVDTYVPTATEQKIINVKGALTNILSGKNLIGLMITGFDADHFNEVGLSIVLNKYRPNWIMYPRYFKKTDNADRCFRLIDQYDNQNKKFNRISVLLQDNAKRWYKSIANDFEFQIFSPHAGDMNCSNNCSLVCKVTENSSQQSYLVTGDTETDRWANIVGAFGNDLKCHMMAAPHHGSRNGISADVLRCVTPHTIIVSAGVKNQFGHPHSEAASLFGMHSKKWFQTNVDPDGQTIQTVLLAGQDPTSYKFEI